MTVLKFVAHDGRELGMLSWFPVHGTSMNSTNRLVSSDNKGLASIMFESWKMNQKDEAGFVAAFAQANEGDVSPNTNGPVCIDTGLSCDAMKSTCDGRVGIYFMFPCCLVHLINHLGSVVKLINSLFLHCTVSVELYLFYKENERRNDVFQKLKHSTC